MTNDKSHFKFKDRGVSRQDSGRLEKGSKGCLVEMDRISGRYPEQ